MAQVVEAQPDESLAVIRSRILSSAERDVILVVPRGTRSLQTPVGAKVLARAVLDHHLRLAVVSRDPQADRHLRDAGLSLYSSVAKAENARRWNTPPRSESLPTPNLDGRLAATAPPENRSWAERLLGVSLLLLLLVVVGAGTALLLPEGRVTVRPATQEIAADVRLSVVPGLEAVDYERVAIPGRMISTVLTGTGNQPTTSRRDQPDERAKGEVLLINQQSVPVTVPLGSVVSTGSGAPVRFRTTAEAQLPGTKGASVPVPIEAFDPGPQGNVGPYLINRLEGLAGSQVTAINEKPTEGGTVRQVGVITEADQERLRAALLQRLEMEAHSLLQTLLQPGETAARETLRRTGILNEGFDRMLGDSADQLNLTLRAEFEEMAFSAADANRIALAGLQGAVPEGFELLGRDLGFEIAGVEAAEEGALLLTVRARGVVRAKITPGEVRSLVAGLPADEAVRLLDERLHLAEPAQVETSPGWVTTLPSLGFRMQVTVLQ